MTESIKMVLISVISAACIGAGSAYLAVVVTLATTQADIIYMKEDLTLLREIVRSVNDTKTEQVRRGEMFKNITARVSGLERTQALLIEQTRDRIKRQEHDKDIEMLMRKLDLKH